METIEVEIKIDQKFYADVTLGQVIDGINELPMTKRWNHIANIINEVQLDLSNTTQEQREVIQKYLQQKLALFENQTHPRGDHKPTE